MSQTDASNTALADLDDDELGALVRETEVFRTAVAARKVDDWFQEFQGTEQHNRLLDEVVSQDKCARSTVRRIVSRYHQEIASFAKIADDEEELAGEAAKEAVED